MMVVGVYPIITHLYKLWLNGGGVYAFIVEEALDILCNAHVITQIQAADVSRRDDAVAGQLPYVELVNGQHSLHLPCTEW